MYKVDIYTKSSGKKPLEKYYDELTEGGNAKETAQIKLAIERLKKYGRAVNEHFDKLVKPLQNDIYELRPGSNRVFFFYFDGNTIVLLHAYRKDKQKTKRIELEKALQEMQDYKRRHQHE